MILILPIFLISLCLVAHGKIQLDTFPSDNYILENYDWIFGMTLEQVPYVSYLRDSKDLFLLLQDAEPIIRRKMKVIQNDIEILRVRRANLTSRSGVVVFFQLKSFAKKKDLDRTNYDNRWNATLESAEMRNLGARAIANIPTHTSNSVIYFIGEYDEVLSDTPIWGMWNSPIKTLSEPATSPSSPPLEASANVRETGGIKNSGEKYLKAQHPEKEDKKSGEKSTTTSKPSSSQDPSKTANASRRRDTNERRDVDERRDTERRDIGKNGDDIKEMGGIKKRLIAVSLYLEKNAKSLYWKSLLLIVLGWSVFFLSKLLSSKPSTPHVQIDISLTTTETAAPSSPSPLLSSPLSPLRSSLHITTSNDFSLSLSNNSNATPSTRSLHSSNFQKYRSRLSTASSQVLTHLRNTLLSPRTSLPSVPNKASKTPKSSYPTMFAPSISHSSLGSSHDSKNQKKKILSAATTPSGMRRSKIEEKMNQRKTDTTSPISVIKNTFKLHQSNDSVNSRRSSLNLEYLERGRRDSTMSLSQEPLFAFPEND